MWDFGTRLSLCFEASVTAFLLRFGNLKKPLSTANTVAEIRTVYLLNARMLSVRFVCLLDVVPG
jgi:hypothetical protein